MEKNGKKTTKAKTKGRSSTLDVLGPTGLTGPTRKSNGKWAHHQKELIELRERLLNNRQNHSEEAREEMSSFSLHMADAGTDSYDRDWALAMASSNQSIIYEIDQALTRIQDGNYGICEWTGEAIEPERLKAVPWARFSMKAQAELEARGAAGKTQLGELGSYARFESSDLQAEDREPAKSEEVGENREAA